MKLKKKTLNSVLLAGVSFPFKPMINFNFNIFLTYFTIRGYIAKR